MIGRDEPAQVVFNEFGNPTYVVGTGTESGRLIGVLDAHDELVRFPEPPVDRPESWPRGWWVPVIGGEDPWH